MLQSNKEVFGRRRPTSVCLWLISMTICLDLEFDIWFSSGWIFTSGAGGELIYKTDVTTLGHLSAVLYSLTWNRTPPILWFALFLALALSPLQRQHSVPPYFVSITRSETLLFAPSRLYCGRIALREPSFSRHRHLVGMAANLWNCLMGLNGEGCAFFFICPFPMASATPWELMVR